MQQNNFNPRPNSNEMNEDLRDYNVIDKLEEVETPSDENNLDDDDFDDDNLEEDEDAPATNAGLVEDDDLIPADEDTEETDLDDEEIEEEDETGNMD